METSQKLAAILVAALVVFGIIAVVYWFWGLNAFMTMYFEDKGWTTIYPDETTAVIVAANLALVVIILRLATSGFSESE